MKFSIFQPLFDLHFYFYPSFSMISYYISSPLEPCLTPLLLHYRNHQIQQITRVLSKYEPNSIAATNLRIHWYKMTYVHPPRLYNSARKSPATGLFNFIRDREQEQRREDYHSDFSGSIIEPRTVPHFNEAIVNKGEPGSQVPLS